ncbi:uncharacterized protein [Ptychodera flava]|uniref:uncharacterized protein n=1 Tax=Ptychodera flava TaxID=63121 RepID=UPI00396A7560
MLNLTGFQICDVSRGRKPLTLVLCPLLALWCSLYFLSLTATIERDEVTAKEMKVLSDESEYFDYHNTLLDLIARYPWLWRRRYVPNSLAKHVKQERPRSYGANATMVFVHNQKAGGTSVKTCLKLLERESNMRRCYGIFDGNGPVHIMEAVRAKSTSRRCYVGESSFGICDDLDDGDCAYFTMLRDPYERVISSHEYCKTADDPLCRAGNATELSLEEWALQQGSYFFRQLLLRPTEICVEAELFNNLLTQYLNKTDQSDEIVADLKSFPCWYRHKLLLEGVLSDSDKNALLRYVLENLDNWFSVIGMTDEFDTSLELFQFAFGLPFHDLCSAVFARETTYTEQSAGAEGGKAEVVRKLKSRLASNDHVRRALLYDIKIFERAKEIFEMQKTSYRHFAVRS